MPSHENLKSLPPDVLWEFLKWLAFGQGRYVGVRIEPGTAIGQGGKRIQGLAEQVLRAARQPDDTSLNVKPPAIEPHWDDPAIVAAIAEFVAARQIALYRDAADFEPRDAIELQEDAIRRFRDRVRPTDL